MGGSHILPCELNPDTKLPEGHVPKELQLITLEVIVSPLAEMGFPLFVIISSR